MLSDLRYACRSLAKSPGFTTTALLTLALGIGVNTSMFTVLNTLLFQPLHFAHPEQLVRVFRTAPESQTWPHAEANYLDLKAQSHAFSRLAAYNAVNCNYVAPGQPAERLRGIDATGEFFPLLGVGAELGRTFTPEETRPGGPPVVVLSHDCWIGRFGADREIIGRQIRIDGSLVTVVGVMPASFVPRLLWGPTQLWRPMIFSPQQAQNRENNYLSILGRLAPGMALEQAQAESSTIAKQLEQQFPLTNTGSGLRLADYADNPNLATDRRLTWFVMALAGFVLLIGCANLANLQFARTTRRAHEHAIRIALGAPRWRIMRELLVESLMLAFAGGASGLLVALWCNDLLGRQIVVGPGRGLALPLDLRVFSFTLAVSLICGLALGLWPALTATRADVNSVLKQQGRGSTSGRSHNRVRQALIVAEVALALMLLAGAGVFVRALQQFGNRDPGWRPDGLLTGLVSLPESKYPDRASRSTFFDKLEQTLAANPQILHVAIASSMPTSGYVSSTNFIAEGLPPPRHGDEPLGNIAFVSPGFFETLGLPVLRGRTFTHDDREGKPLVVVINEALARALWPGQDPVGHRLGDYDPNDHNWMEIVGVVGDARSPGELTPPDTLFQIYRPIAQETLGFATLAVRGRGAPELLASELQRAVSTIDPDQPVHGIITARGEIEEGLANYHLQGFMLSGFALLGLALAAIGIYGVLAGFVAQRTNEIGVRMALGAQVSDVLRLVLARGLWLAGIGTALGLFGAFGLVRLLTHILPELGAPDPLIIAGVVVILLGIALFACWLPARRASRLNPIEALRAE
jgi:predicted permease